MNEWFDEQLHDGSSYRRSHRHGCALVAEPMRGCAICGHTDPAYDLTADQLEKMQEDGHKWIVTPGIWTLPEPGR